jgi:type I restriction enzyme M protein
MKISQDEINSILWRACDTFRGVIDPSDYKNYLLVMLFVKYISDVWEARKEELTQKYGGNAEMVERQLTRERFLLPEGASFSTLFAKRNADNIGEVIDIALEEIEDQNRRKLEGVFRNISFNSDNLGETKDRNRRIKNLLEAFADPRLDLRPSAVSEDVVGNAYMYLIENFASDSGKKGGEFYTPTGVSVLLAKLLRPKPGDRISDPTCGSGSLLIRIAGEIPEHERHNYSLFGQESNGSTWALCRMNMVLHDEDSAQIKWGDTLNNPLLIENDRLLKFNIVTANPPFSLDKWGAEHAEGDRFKRFWRGVPPKSKADYAFISHMIETALPLEGRVAVIVPHGVLFRGAAEGKIRRSFIDENLLDAVIGLPANLFFGTGIPAAILLFDRSREPGGANADRSDVLFVDGSRGFQAGKNGNILRLDDIAEIAGAYHARAEITRYSRAVPVTEIAANDCNLNIARYIDTFEAQASVDIAALQQEISALEHDLAAVRAKLDSHLRDLEVIA